MSDELEVAAMAAASGVLTDTDGKALEDKPITACRNCGEPVQARYCGSCGQLAQNFHRPLPALIAELAGDFFALDGRVARTIPGLLFNPGKVTRSYLDGQRQRYVPPFRLYLLASFIFFLCLFSFGQAHGWFQLRFELKPTAERLVTNDTDQTDSTDSGTGTSIPDADGSPSAETGIDVDRIVGENGRVDRAYLDQRIDEMIDTPRGDTSFIKSIVNAAADIYDNQPLFLASMKSAAPRLALILTPALLFCFIFVFPFRRGVYFYDHVIAALHFQTWVYFLSTICVGLAWLGLGGNLIALILFLTPPVYLYRFFRNVYYSGRVFGLIRTFIVLAMLNLVFFLWVLAVIALSAGETSELSRQLTQN